MGENHEKLGEEYGEETRDERSFKVEWINERGKVFEEIWATSKICVGGGSAFPLAPPPY